MRPTSHKGRLRVAMEQRLREATERGMRAIVLRAGDYFGHGRGSWFDLVIAREIGRGRVTYPGPLDTMHEWTYLPDLARAFVQLAERRAGLPGYASFGFAGHAVTGTELTAAMAAATQRRLAVKRMSWWLIRTVGRLSPMGRELAEIEYLWRVPHRISGDALAAVIGPIPHTPLHDAVAAALRDLGHVG
jgi:nucleoside-diphosphate-sugar epimerase